MSKSLEDLKTLKAEFRPHLQYLGTAVGALHDGGLERETIEFCVGEILDKIEQLKADPERLEKFKAGLAALTD